MNPGSRTWGVPRHGDAGATDVGAAGARAADARATGVGSEPSDYGSDLSGGGMGSRRAGELGCMGCMGESGRMKDMNFPTRGVFPGMGMPGLRMPGLRMPGYGCWG